MGQPNKLPLIAEAYGKELDELIPATVQEEGSISAAATKLGVNTNTIQNWMTRNGWKSVTRQQTVLVRDTAKPSPPAKRPVA